MYKKILTVLVLMFSSPSISIAQTKPDLNATWDSGYGYINWHGWYSKPTQLLFGDLRLSGGRWVFEGKYSNMLKPSSQGTVFFEFSPDGRSFTGRWKNSNSGRSNSWSGQQVAGKPYYADTAYVAQHGTPICTDDLFKKGKRVGPDSSACSIPKDFNGLSIDGLINDMNYDKFHGACSKHDMCYSSPWRARGAEVAGKSACDSRFLDDLQSICDEAHNDGSPRWMRCRAAGRTMSVAVNNFLIATDAYKAGQKWAELNCR